MFLSVLAGLAMAACTSDELVVDDTPAASQSGKVAAGATGYVSVAINMPTEPVPTSTRADVFSFEDGVEAEYTVNDATLIIFSKASETDDDDAAKLFAAYTLEYQGTDSTEPEVTQTSQYVRQIVAPEGKAYALVVLNGKTSNFLTVVGEDEDELGSLTIGGTQLTTTNTFADFLTAVPADVNDIANLGGSNFLMANAPLYTAAGGSSAPSSDGSLQTLVPLSIYGSNAEATAAAADEIYVERAVAKVTVTSETLSDVSVIGFRLDNTNEWMFPVRNASGIETWKDYANEGTEVPTTDKYRFVGPNEVKTNAGLYRTYWGTDPNYDSSSIQEEGYGLTSIAGTSYDAETYTQVNGTDVNPAYCLENTMDQDNMKQKNTTRAIIAVQMADDSYYTMHKSTTRLSNEEIVAEIIDQLKGFSVVTAAAAEYTDGGDAFYSALESAITFTDGDEGELTSSSSDVRVAISLDDFSATSFGDATGEGDSETSEVLTALKSGIDDIVTTLNANTIYYYADGVALFPVLIKHFGDELTPWTAEDITNEAYYNANDHLGRYGVLRNTWYEINVTSVTGPGYPTVPTPDEDTWDDPTEQWINTEINIMKWAKRTQDVDL